MSDLWKNIFVAVLSVFLTFLIQQYYYFEEDKIKKLDVNTSFNPDYLSKPKFPDANVKLTVDGVDKEKLGLYEISIINYTSESYMDLPIHISVRPENPNTFKLLSHFAVGEKGMEDLVKEKNPMKFDGQKYKFFYSLSTLNRAEKDESGLTLSLLFEGSKEPNLEVVVNGINTRSFSRENSPEVRQLQRNIIYWLVAVFTGLIIIIGLVVNPIISILLRPLDRKIDRKDAKSLFDAMRNEKLQKEITDQELKDYVAKILYAQRKATWDTRSFIGKWAVGFREPQRIDFTI